MSEVLVDNITSRSGGAVGAPSGIVVTGVITATSFVGSASGLSGIDATALKDSGGNVKVQGNTSGIVVTGVSTFTDNVSVGGVVTYEDVTNIDSVGIITARDGIKVSAGQSISAVSGIVTYYGDGSKLSGFESGVVNFVASGTIANGDTVIIKDDGTVGIVTQTTSNTPILGSAVVFESARIYSPSSVFDSTNGKVVIAYRDSANSSYGTAVVGTVSGTSISFGTPVVFESAGSYDIDAVYDSTNSKVVIAWRDNPNSNYGTTIVGTVSGTSISFGSPVVFASAGSNTPAMTFDSTNGKVIIAWMDNGNSNYGTAIVGTVSGTSISFGTEVVFESSSTYYPSITYDTNSQRVVIAYTDTGDSNYGKAVVGTVSGTSISFGTPVTFESRHASSTSCAFDSSNNKVVIAFRAEDNSNYGTAVVGTVSGTSISFGSQVVYRTAIANFNSAVYDPDLGKIVIAYQISGGGKFVTGTVSGTSISFGSETDFSPGSSASYNSATYDSTNNKVVISWQDGGNSDHGTSRVLQAGSQSTNLTAENYIGIAAEAISNGATGKINVFSGTNTGQTGLTTAQKYFVQNDGTLATSAGSPSVVAGTAISDTKIVVR